MKKMLFSFCFIGLFNIVQAQDKSADIQEIAERLEGSYDNFLQVWQQKTTDEKHKVEAEGHHDHYHQIHNLIEHEAFPIFELKVYLGRLYKNELLHALMTVQEVNGALISYMYAVNDLATAKSGVPDGKSFASVKWRRDQDKFLGYSDSGAMIIELTEDLLVLHENSGSFVPVNGEPYKLIKCRQFSGWIQYPIPEIPDSTFFMSDQQIHDQGGLLQLQLSDGTKVDYTVELTQLVYGKRISLMKLAIYDMPPEEVDWNSKSISYTWTSPEAKRIGINLRKVVSGWTLIEPEFLNANNMDKK